jgi:DNA mismatch endonuclease, patch repair protein
MITPKKGFKGTPWWKLPNAKERGFVRAKIAREKGQSSPQWKKRATEYGLQLSKDFPSTPEILKTARDRVDHEKIKETLRKPEMRKKMSASLKEYYRLHPEMKSHLRELRLKQVLPTRNTQIEVKVQSLLLSHGIEFFAHYPVNGRQIDILLKGRRIAISCNGCYWHCCPEHFPFAKTSQQKQNQKYDQTIDSVIEGAGYRHLVFWEHEILSDNFDNEILRRLEN